MKYIYEEIIENDILMSVLRTDENGKVWSIPTDPANSDYQRYLKWLKNPEAEETTLTL